MLTRLACHVRAARRVIERLSLSRDAFRRTHSVDRTREYILSDCGGAAAHELFFAYADWNNSAVRAFDVRTDSMRATRIYAAERGERAWRGVQRRVGLAIRPHVTLRGPVAEQSNK